MIIEKIEKKVNDEEFCSALHTISERLGYKVNGNEVTKNNETYKIEKISKTEHDYGRGGYRINSTSIFKTDKKPKKILETRDYQSWTTLSDDSEDYIAARDQFVALFSEDEFGRAIFERLKC